MSLCSETQKRRLSKYSASENLAETIKDMIIKLSDPIFNTYEKEKMAQLSEGIHNSSSYLY